MQTKDFMKVVRRRAVGKVSEDEWRQFLNDNLNYRDAGCQKELPHCWECTEHRTNRWKGIEVFTVIKTDEVCSVVEPWSLFDDDIESVLGVPCRGRIQHWTGCSEA